MPGETAKILPDVIDALEASPAPAMLDVAYDVLREPLDLRFLWLYLADYSDEELHPYPAERVPAPPEESLSVDGTVGGRVYLTRQPHVVENADGWVLWLPVFRPGESVGVLALGLEDDNPTAREIGPAVARAIGAGVLEARGRSDEFEVARGARDLQIAGVLQWELLPLPTYRDPFVQLAGRVEPAYDIGGDAFDFAVNRDCVHIALFDAMGHGISATLLTTLAVGAYRQSRRRQEDLSAIARDLDVAVARLSAEAFVTGHVCRFDHRSGVLSWLNAGHPVPLLIRHRAASDLGEAEPMLPFGLGDSPKDVVEVPLQPGDLVAFYSDGVTEARPREGGQFGVERLADMAARHADADVLVASRQMLNDVRAHANMVLRDDATLVLMRWAGPGETGRT
jgi:serine phosphatase RsbU (regulator of sigma subunit)